MDNLRFDLRGYIDDCHSLHPNMYEISIEERRSFLDTVERNTSAENLKNYCMQNPSRLNWLIDLFKGGQIKKDQEYIIALITSTTPVQLPIELNYKILSCLRPGNYVVSKEDFFDANKYKIQGMEDGDSLQKCGFSTAEIALEFIKTNIIKNIVHADFTGLPREDEFLKKLADSQAEGWISLTSLNLNSRRTLNSFSISGKKDDHKYITDLGLSYIAKMHFLTQLNLSECEGITNLGLSYIAQMPFLTQLNLSGSEKIKDQGLAHLKEMSLTHFNLSLCGQITDLGLASFTAMPLKQLNLRGCGKITDVGLEQLAQMLLLTELNLNACWQITDFGLSKLKSMPLTRLDLRFCREITDAGFQHLKLLALTKLYLNSCNITNAGLAHLVEMPLTQLDLSSTQITDVGLEHIKAMPLKKLRLSNCGITNAGIAHLAKISLTSLNIHHCQLITDIGLEHLKAMPLTQLDLSSTQTTNVGLEHLKAMPLKKLRLSNCGGITNAGIVFLLEKPLVELDLTFCWKITRDGVAPFRIKPSCNLSFHLSKDC